MPRLARLSGRGRLQNYTRCPTCCSTRLWRPAQPLLLRRQHVSTDSSTTTTNTNTSSAPDKDKKKQEDEDEAKETRKRWKSYAFKVFETSSTTFFSILILGIAGYSYHKYYKRLELERLEIAFEAGYSTPELASLGRHPDFARSKGTTFTLEDHWIPREEQEGIDAIVNGTNQGNYHLIFGEKGTGKTSMLLEAMKKIDGEGVAMLDAHADLEIFRVRLGKALNYDFHEDYIGSLFSFRGPRDSTPLLDIERAFNKMEKIALKRRDEVGKPLILIINGIHLLRDDHDGRDLLELIQQRAEMWAASKLVTVIFNSDNYWVSERLKQQATRMIVHSIGDIPKHRVIAALKTYRQRNFQETVSDDLLNQVFSKIGGRASYLTRIAKAPDMLETASRIVEREKNWFLSQCWILGMEMDDDVQQHQKYCAAAMVLAQALVEREKTTDPDKLPSIPLHEARQIMTRADFVENFDHINIIAVDANNRLKAGSVAMQNAFREVCQKEGFKEHLQRTLLRLDELESLERTREVTLKDLWNNGEFRFEKKDPNQSGWSLKALFQPKRPYIQPET